MGEGPDAAFLRSRLDGQWRFAVDDASWVFLDELVRCVFAHELLQARDHVRRPGLP
jgi:hypothetical protein